MTPLKIILVVDDNAVNRTVLSKILSEKYGVIEAENGQIALELLKAHRGEIAAVILDLVMPVMDGYAVLEEIMESDYYGKLPIVVTTGMGNNEDERRALSLGAWDFVLKPYDAQIIMFRLKNAIDRSQLSAFKQLKYLAEYDALTGIYNKAKFFESAREMIDGSCDKKFVFIRFDVDRFQLINSFFGAEEGDKLLKYIAKHLEKDAKSLGEAAFGRIGSDVFGFCMPYDKKTTQHMIGHAKKMLEKYNPNYDIVPSVGIYIIDDNTIPVEEMYNRATLAAKICKGNYVDFYAYYNESMSVALANEQKITNDMNFALENGQFEIYMQPQYDLHTNLPCGAEALVRWRHRERGLLSPGEFIPVFERNGFIIKLDYYVWEQTCKCLCRWIAQGIKPYPVSVNVSRVNFYNPKLVETLLELVDRYQLEPALLNLELTESSYTDNPTAMKKVMTQLQNHGFTIMMDDFGSGYSSLALLKDIAIDVLKIDMLFLSKTEIPGRGENIIASVIRMAKWLNIPIIAEGAETAEQVDFLRSVGCDFVQGYYFARPMPISEYEKFCDNLGCAEQANSGQEKDIYRYDDLFSDNQEMKRLFNSALQVAVIYEFAGDQVEMIRVNEAYYALLGHEDMLARSSNIIELMEAEYRAPLLNAFRTCIETKGIAECEYMRKRAGEPVWIHAKLHYASMVGSKHIIIGELTDITMRKVLESEFQKYRENWLPGDRDTCTVLIVDDAAINRTVLKKILQDEFTFLEAENGIEAIRVLQDNQSQIELILLDISMPIMDGKEFLQYKQKKSELDAIPVIMITADDSPEQQTKAFSLGANDYIIKPFIPAVVVRRVKNVLESNRRFQDMVREYNAMSAQVKTDLMTGLVNRASVEKIISKRLADTTKTCVMIMLDIDNFKKINDTRGHDYGDKVICRVAEQLRLHFRKEDITARMGGDEFAVFMGDISDMKLVETKAHRFCESMRGIKIDGQNAGLSCSVGIAISNKQAHSFESLYQNADKALYSAKCRGRNTVSIYGEESGDASISKWITDVESVVDTINDSIYVCDNNSYELIYANDNLCKSMGVTRESCKGKKCHEVLMNRDTPCEFCSIAEMIEDKVYTRIFQAPNTSQIFLMRGKTVKWNGTLVHMEVAVDVTEVGNMGAYCEGASDNGGR